MRVGEYFGVGMFSRSHSEFFPRLAGDKKEGQCDEARITESVANCSMPTDSKFACESYSDMKVYNTYICDHSGSVCRLRYISCFP